MNRSDGSGGQKADEALPAAVSSGSRPRTQAASSRTTGRRKEKRAAPRLHKLIDTNGPPPATSVSDVRLTIGVILGPHGVHGELKMRLTTNDPDHLRDLKTVFLGSDERPRRLVAVRFQADHALISIEGIATREEGQQLRGVPVRIAGDEARPLAPGEFFLYQLIGLIAYGESGDRLGIVTDLIETGAHDVFVISSNVAPDLLIPNHPDFVQAIEPAAGRLIVRPPEYGESRPADGDDTLLS